MRHAEAEGNVNRHFHGWTDSSITKSGHRQAELLAEKIMDYKIDILYSSSLKRTVQTAEWISKATSLQIIKIDGLKEINGGDWENELWSDLPKLWPDEYKTWENEPEIHKMPNGESMKDFLDRLAIEISSIVSQNKGKKVCVVTHGTAIRVLMSYFHKKDLSLYVNIPWYDNTSITVVEFSDDDCKILLEGDATHLSNDLKTIEKQDWWKAKNEKINNSKHVGEI